MLTRGDRLAHWLGLKKWFRLDVLPVAFAFPTGLVIGDAWPFIPLPRKILIEILNPIELTGDPESTQDLQRGYDQVTAVMQEALCRLVLRLPRSKRSPIK